MLKILIHSSQRYISFIHSILLHWFRWQWMKFFWKEISTHTRIQHALHKWTEHFTFFCFFFFIFECSALYFPSPGRFRSPSGRTKMFEIEIEIEKLNYNQAKTRETIQPPVCNKWNNNINASAFFLIIFAYQPVKWTWIRNAMPSKWTTYRAKGKW